jgi:peptidoglycan/xylan/chitin deacetylase (PgdA/CDA1 family)
MRRGRCLAASIRAGWCGVRRGRCLAASICVITVAGCGGSYARPAHRQVTHSSTATPLTVTRSTPQAQPRKPAALPPHRVITGQIPDRLPTTRRVVALTFDAGADNVGAPKITAALVRAGVPATFFMTGRWAQLYPQWARRIAARYPIGNHTFDHRDVLGLSLPAVRTEVLEARAAIQRATGHPPVALFRFPYGSSSASTLGLVNQLGYTAVGWTVDTLGWEGTSMGQSVGSVTSRALDHLQPGEIILMHVGANPTDHSTLDADALPGIITAIRARGYRFVSVNEYL